MHVIDSMSQVSQLSTRAAHSAFWELLGMPQDSMLGAQVLDAEISPSTGVN